MNAAISASILAADVTCLGDEVDHVLLSGAGRVHLDVMDHHYVPNLTFGPLVCEGLRRHGIALLQLTSQNSVMSMGRRCS